jgi:FkbM family methyltransferase
MLIKLRYIKKMLLPLKNIIFPSEEYLNEKRQIKRSKQFYSNFIGKNDLCFDVGANYGNRTSSFLSLKAKVVAIEPQEVCYKYLEKKFGNKIELVRKGLSNEEGVKEFYISETSTISSFSKNWINSVKDRRFKEYDWNKVAQVEMTTLDKLCEQYGIPKFIKIDVEGYEFEVLSGLSKQVKIISFEYTTPEQTNKAIDCLNLIYSLNKNIECNYSVGESMEFTFLKWISFEDMLSVIKSNEFSISGFGDIYVRVII